MVQTERPTVVIVNDDPSQLRLIGAVLEKVGLRGRGCSGVEEALAVLQAEPATALVVTDLHMPGIDGWQFCQLLRSPEYERLNGIPILVVSATFSGSDAERVSLDLGADAFLAAPFAPSALQQYAKALLRGERPAPAPHVLLAHHDVGEAARLRGAFVAHGYHVEVAHTGGDALRAWHAREPDVAVLDDRLPDVPATRLLGAIKRPGARTVVIAISQAAGRHEGLQLARQGVDGTVRDPVEPARLLALCDTIRRQRSLLRIEELLEQRSRALRDSEARWRSLFEAIPEIVMVHDGVGVIRHVNRTGAERLGWPAHDIIGRSLRELERRDGDVDAAGAAGRVEPVEGSFETVYLARDGREIPVEVNRRLMMFDGQPAVLSVARDIGVRRELTRQQQNFLAMLTHDIKNPLAIMLGFTELLGEIGPLSEEQRDLTARMRANANTVLTLVANYLNLTQIQNGKLTLAKQPLSVGSVIESVIEQYRMQALRDDIVLHAEVADALPEVCGDAVALERVLGNLVHNALKFTGECGTVTISAQPDGDGIALRVQDSGIGIQPEDLPTVFEPYRRGTLRQAREGVGLGLFIARALIEAHQGHIAVESAPGAGATFTVWLPAAPDAANVQAFAAGA